MEEKTEPETVRQLFIKGKNSRIIINTLKDHEGIFVEVITTRLVQKYPTKIARHRASYTLETFAMLSSLYQGESQIIANHISKAKHENVKYEAKIYNNTKYLPYDTRF